MKKLLYLDKKSNEIDNLLNNSKDVVMRAANIKKYPFTMIEKGDTALFVNNNTEGIVLASATVKEALFYTIEHESQMNELISKYEDRVKLSKKKLDYIKKRKYVSVFVLSDIQEEYGKIDHSDFGRKKDWIQLIELKKDKT